MSATSLNSPESFRYKVVSPKQLTTAEQESVYHCNYDFLTTSYGVTGWANHQATIKVYDRQLEPNIDRIGRLLESDQLFSDPRLILAAQDDEVKASLFTASRASTQFMPAKYGLVEQLAVLNIDKLVNLRERWLGSLGIRSDVIEQSTDFKADELSVIDVLIYLAMKQGIDRQVVKAQQLGGSLFHQAALINLNFRTDSSATPKTKRLFDPNPKKVEERVWIANSVNSVKKAIERKHDGSAILAS